MIALLLKIFMFYLLFIGFKTLLSSAKKPLKTNPSSAQRGHQKNANDDIIEAEYRVIKD